MQAHTPGLTSVLSCPAGYDIQSCINFLSDDLIIFLGQTCNIIHIGRRILNRISRASYPYAVQCYIADLTIGAMESRCPCFLSWSMLNCFKREGPSGIMILLVDVFIQYKEDHHTSAQYMEALVFAKKLNLLGQSIVYYYKWPCRQGINRPYEGLYYPTSRSSGKTRCYKYTTLS